MAEREAQIAAASPSFTPPPGLVTQLTGVRGVHLIDDDQQASDLAAGAGRTLLADLGVDPAAVDLMLFAACCQDLAEPATSHVVAAKLGLRCPVFDIKNACNSVLNAIQTAQALIATGQHRTVLITCGEAPSLYARLCVPDAQAFARALPGYGLSDAGCALLFTAEEPDPAAPPRGVLMSHFAADSTVWESATVRAGGTLARRRPPSGNDDSFRMESLRMRESLRRLARAELFPLFEKQHLTFDDLAFVGVHQVSLTDVEQLSGPEFGVPRDKLVVTLPRHGNVASASLPLQLSLALETGLARRGDLVALIGLAAGASVGIVVIRL